LLAEGLGGQSFGGNVAILVNESRNSAAEMVAALALEKRARRKVSRRKLALVPLTLLFFDLLFSKR
jgi:hypothetical protein